MFSVFQLLDLSCPNVALIDLGRLDSSWNMRGWNMRGRFKLIFIIWLSQITTVRFWDTLHFSGKTAFIQDV